MLISFCELQASRIVLDTVWKKEARSRKDATHLHWRVGYKWIYTARRGSLFVSLLAIIEDIKYNTARYTNKW